MLRMQAIVMLLLFATVGTIDAGANVRCAFGASTAQAHLNCALCKTTFLRSGRICLRVWTCAARSTGRWQTSLRAGLGFVKPRPGIAGAL